MAATTPVSRHLARVAHEAERHGLEDRRLSALALFLVGGQYFALLYTDDMQVVLGAALVPGYTVWHSLSSRLSSLWRMPGLPLPPGGDNVDLPAAGLQR